MAVTQARTMPGVLELLPLDQVAFQSMLDAIRRNYERFGFLPIETPVMEFSGVLLTKEGGETERQVYFVQSTGALQAAKDGEVPELALRFDLTVPLARYVAEHEHDLVFPFRRYQIQRVYRGERAQRGRFREFYQCDIDVVGKDALSVRYDAELPAVIYNVFRDLDIGAFTIRINNRKLLRGILDAKGIVDSTMQANVLREIDKTDKRGRNATHDALLSLGLSESAAAELLFVLYDACGEVERNKRLDVCTKNLAQGQSPMGTTTDPDLMFLQHSLGMVIPPYEWPKILEDGVAELAEVIRTIGAMGIPRNFYRLDLSVVRGLDYYTGTIYETTLNDHPQIGSICSGGRYENLASHYTKSRLPGVGISIGATRLYWQLREAGLLKGGRSTVQALVAQMDENELPRYLEVATELRAAGINTEAVIEPGKLARQFKYADRAGIRFVLVLGPDEIAKGIVTVKDLRKQDQFEVARAELAETLRVEIEQAAVMPRG